MIGKKNELFNRLIENQCNEKGIDFNKFLVDLEVSVDDLNNWRNSSKYHIKTLIIAEYLNVKPEVLFDCLKTQEKESSFTYNRIKTLCEAKGYKITPYLNKLGYSSSTISEWKNRISVNIDTLIKLAKEFDCSIDYLVGLTDDIHSSNSHNTNLNLQYFINEFLMLDTFQQLDLFNYIDFLKYKEKQIIDFKQEIIPIEVPEKYKEIVNMREQGMTMVQIAIAKNTSKQNISLILKKYTKQE